MKPLLVASLLMALHFPASPPKKKGPPPPPPPPIVADMPGGAP